MEYILNRFDHYRKIKVAVANDDKTLFQVLSPFVCKSQGDRQYQTNEYIFNGKQSKILITGWCVIYVATHYKYQDGINDKNAETV